jgi:hypothetical protein
MTWYPLFVGGAEASQKGFGEVMPARFEERFGIYIDVYFIIGLRHE